MAELRAAEVAAPDVALAATAPSGAEASNPWQARRTAVPLFALVHTLASHVVARQPLVSRFRALRESLTSEGVSGALALRAYEASAEACLRAGDAGEYLKCQQRLLSQLYPGAAHEEAARWAEFAACGALYFACCSFGGDSAAETACSLRAIPSHLLRAPPLLCALRALGALARRDGAAFCAEQAHADATPLMRLLMARRLPDARRAALAAASRAFKTLPCAAAVRMLRLPRDEALGPALVAAATAPGAPAQLVAAAKAFGAAAAPPPELTFAVAAS